MSYIQKKKPRHPLCALNEPWRCYTTTMAGTVFSGRVTVYGLLGFPSSRWYNSLQTVGGPNTLGRWCRHTVYSCSSQKPLLQRCTSSLNGWSGWFDMSINHHGSEWNHQILSVGSKILPVAEQSPNPANISCWTALITSLRLVQRGTCYSDPNSNISWPTSAWFPALMAALANSISFFIWSSTGKTIREHP